MLQALCGPLPGSLPHPACSLPELQEVSVQTRPAASDEAPAAKIVFLAGPDSYLPGPHEHKAGAVLLSAALRARKPPFETVNIYGAWPTDERIFDGADAIVVYCDGGKSHLINDHLPNFGRLLDKGVGVVALHYCVEVPKDSPSSAALLLAIGGYFETWWSVNPAWEAQFVALPFERSGGGRGFEYTGGHYRSNWENDDARELLLNAIEWVVIKP